MNKLIVGFVLATLILSTAGMGMASANNANNAPPELQKVTFVHYAKSADKSKPVADENADIYKLMCGGIKWDHTMTYVVNPAGSNLNNKEVMNALQASLDTWNTAISETSPNIILFDPIVSGTGVVSYVSGNGVNSVTWGDLDTGIIAVNSFWFSPTKKVILESDVIFNTDYVWSSSENCPDNAMDLQNIATHEFGHNGLSDLYSPPSMALTMYGYSDFGETYKRTLGYGDILGIQELYGE